MAISKNIGRPTKYDPNLIEKVDEYITLCKDTEEEFHKTRGQSSDSYERIIRVKLPTRDGFAIFIDVNQDTLVEWAKQYDLFSVALQKIDKVQKRALIDNGLAGTYNPTIAKLLLASNHGMRDGVDITSNNKDLIPDKQSKERADEALNSFLK